jgi:predicted enzyme related to lactoylglutathione lyase
LELEKVFTNRHHYLHNGVAVQNHRRKSAMALSFRQLTYAAPVLRVTDLQRSIAYYRMCLGFDVEFDYGSFYAGLIREDCRIHLKCAAALARDQVAIEAEEHLDICCGVRDAHALSTFLGNSGADILVPLRQVPYGWEVYARDPDGYLIGFVQSE